MVFYDIVHLAVEVPFGLEGVLGCLGNLVANSVICMFGISHNNSIMYFTLRNDHTVLD